MQIFTLCVSFLLPTEQITTNTPHQLAHGSVGGRLGGRVQAGSASFPVQGHRAENVRVSARLASYPEATSMCIHCWRKPLPYGCRSEAPVSLLISQGPLSVPAAPESLLTRGSIVKVRVEPFSHSSPSRPLSSATLNHWKVLTEKEAEGRKSLHRAWRGLIPLRPLRSQFHVKSVLSDSDTAKS